jgi:DNA polymerase-3 subunit gamma/tau
MSYVSFYRKWRPQTFSEIVGQEYVVKTLQNAISKKRISHSYIFCGPKGTGKTSLARVFAKGLNCEKGPTSNPCNKCSNCLSIAAGTNVDVIEIDAASNRGIDDIRDLREKVRYLPVNLRKKVYIIDEAHQITPAAFNAFLKVLEEPPEHVIFIMATTEPHEVLPTIMSRCQRFDFEPVPVDKIKKRLKSIASSENIDINDSAVNLIAKHADGSLRDSDGILEQLSSFEDKKITVDDVTSLLGIIDQDMLFELANIFLEKNLNQAILFIQRVIASNFNLRVFTTEFLEHLFTLYAIKNYDKPMDILDVGEDDQERYYNQAGLFLPYDMEYLIELFTDLLKQLKWGESSKTFFKTTIIKAINHDLMDKAGSSDRVNKIDSLSREPEVKKVLKKPDIQDFKKNTAGDKKGADIKQSEKSVKEAVKPEGLEDDMKKEAVKAVKKEEGHEEKCKDLKPSECKKIILKNWDKLLSTLKKENISIQAMFVETLGFKLDGNKIIFYLAENKKWHKDHLAKTKNSLLIQQLLREVTGKSFQINFEILDSPEDTEIVMVNPGNQGNSKDTDNTETRVNSVDEDLSGKNNDGEGDVLKYLEEKFEIKKE